MATVTAASSIEPWRDQLRDRLGKWIEMGSKVSWIARGQTKSGTVVGTPRPGTLTVQDEKTKVRVNVPAARVVPYFRTTQDDAVTDGLRIREIPATKLKIAPAKAAPAVAIPSVLPAPLAKGRVTPGGSFPEYVIPKQALALERLSTVRSVLGVDPDLDDAIVQLEMNHPLAALHDVESIQKRLSGRKDRMASRLSKDLKRVDRWLRDILIAQHLSSPLGIGSTLIAGVVPPFPNDNLIAAGQAWMSQIRDSQGQWIQMGATVAFMQQGKPVTGEVVGSPSPGMITVRTASGKEITVPAAAVTVAGGPAPDKKAVPATEKKAAAPAEKGRSKGRGTTGSPAKASLTRANEDKPDDKRLAEMARSADRIELLIRARGKGRDPFGEKESRSKAKDRKAKEDAKGAKDDEDEEEPTAAEKAKKRAAARKSRKKRKDTRKKLTSTQVSQVTDIFKQVLTDVKNGRYNSAIARLEKAADLLKNTSAPWLNQRIAFLKKGLKGLSGSGVTAAARYVRTPEGARYYDEEIGNMIRADHLLGRLQRAILRSISPDKPSRPANAVSSLGGLDPRDQAFVNNGNGGTLDDPVHHYEWKSGRSLTVRQSDVAAHLRDVIGAALSEGAVANRKASPEAVAKAQQWYRDAHQTCVTIRDDFNRQHPGTNLTLEQVTGVMAAVSPRQRWEQNILSCRKVIAAHLSGELDPDIHIAKYQTNAGLSANVEGALRLLRGEDASVVTGLKRKSFWNCLMDPDNQYDVTIDGWMASSLWRMGGVYDDGTPVDEKSLSWINHSATRDKVEVVEGAGYILLADAVREVAAELEISPMEAQAIYWVAVGGGERNTQMWSDERRAPKATVKTMSAGGQMVIPEIDDDGGEWTSPNDFDAVAINDMAQTFRTTAGDGLSSPLSAWETTGPHPTAGHISFCWENPDAWKILGEDVDRLWFMEQVVTRTGDVPLG